MVVPRNSAIGTALWVRRLAISPFHRTSREHSLSGSCDDEVGDQRDLPWQDSEIGLEDTPCEAKGGGFRHPCVLAVSSCGSGCPALATVFLWFDAVPGVQVSLSFWVDSVPLNVSLSANHRISSFSHSILSISLASPFPLPRAPGRPQFFRNSGFTSSYQWVS